MGRAKWEALALLSVWKSYIGMEVWQEPERSVACQSIARQRTGPD